MKAEQKASMYMLEEKKDKTLSDYKLLVEWKDKQIAELSKKNDNLKSTYRKQRNKRIDDLQKENAELKSRECWKSCEYANPKAELIGQHIKDVQNLTKAKEIIREVMNWYWETDICSDSMPTELRQKAEQFLNSEVEK